MGLRWYQEEAVESIFTYFEANNGNPVVALPTGTGKSHVIAGFAERAMRTYPGTSILVATHVKELVEQNAAKVAEAWPSAPMGINSAGLNRRDTKEPLLFAGIGSIRNNVSALARRDLMLIDECHLVSPNGETTYRKVIDELKETNPYLKVIGLTATNFRLGQGKLTDGGLFTDTCYDLTNIEGFSRLLYEGHLAPVYPQPTKTEIDMSGVGISHGEFKQNDVQNALDDDATLRLALIEMCEKGWDRRAWIIFTAGVENAEKTARILNEFGVASAAVHSKLKKSERDAIIRAYKSGQLRCVVNNNVLTTGFDHPPIDFVGMLRPTMSPGLWVQMLGRATRPSPETGKENALCLDFAGNARRLGPINDPVIPRRPGNGVPGDAPVKICDNCGTYNHTSVRVCGLCGTEFELKEGFGATSGTAPLMRSEECKIEQFTVDRVYYNKHVKKSTGGASLRVDYMCGIQRFTEFVLFEHKGFPGNKARNWWRQRHSVEPPLTVDEALSYVSQLTVPSSIDVWVNKQYPEIMRYNYG